MHRMPRITLATALLAVAAACGGGNDAGNDTGLGATGATGAATGAATAAGGDMSNQDIVAAMAAANAAEIAAGKLAADSATNAQVKAFGRKMVTEHQAMNEQAHHAAQQAGVTSEPGQQTGNVVETSRNIAQELQGKRGADFDRAFMDAMVRSHEQTLELLNRAAQSVTAAPALKTAVTEAQPKVQQHLEEARQIQGRLQGS